MSAGDGAGTGTADIAKQQVSSVTQSAGDAAGQVAGTAQEQAREVVSEAKAQVSDLGRQFKSQVDEQANTQRDRLVGTLRSLSDELETMADNGDRSGLATDAARQLADRGRRAAGFLEDKQPGDLVQQVTDFARRRPGAFLLGAAAAGLLAGRLTRGVTANNAGDPSESYPSEGYPSAFPDVAMQPPLMAGQYPTSDMYGTAPPAGGYGDATANPVPDYPYQPASPQPAAYGMAPGQQPYPPPPYPPQPYPTESYPTESYPAESNPAEPYRTEAHPAEYPPVPGDEHADPSREGYRP
ncbi:MAG: hypothetical protein H0V10_14265 [Geodermatophilaceae bacterium]|nr:hypothetical protein [Geodermatophilaceae bacterium]